jgi:glutathione S-transferase
MIMATVCRNVLRERSASWFAEDRQRRFGKTLDQYERDEGGDVAWQAAQKGLESLKLEIQQNKRDDGPFVLGSTITYGDFLVAAIFNWLERVHPAVYGKFVGYDESFKKLHEACRPWLKRDD